MRILLVSSSSGSKGGGEIYLLRLGTAIRQLGHEVALWTSEHSRMDELSRHFEKIGTVFRSTYSNTYDRCLRGLAFLQDSRQTAEAVCLWKG